MKVSKKAFYVLLKKKALGGTSHALPHSRHAWTTQSHILAVAFIEKVQADQLREAITFLLPFLREIRSSVYPESLGTTSGRTFITGCKVKTSLPELEASLTVTNSGSTYICQ